MAGCNYGPVRVVFKLAERASGDLPVSPAPANFKKTVTVMDYNDLINSNEVVMVEFFATWCPHCQKMMPVVEQLRQLVNGNVDIHQLDIDRNGEAANAAGVESVPTFIIYKDGREQWRQSGEIDGEVLLSRIEAY